MLLKWVFVSLILDWTYRMSDIWPSPAFWLFISWSIRCAVNYSNLRTLLEVFLHL